MEFYLNTYILTKMIKYHIFSKVNFPAVTVCNQNRVSCENLISTMTSCKNETFGCDANDVEVMGSIVELSKCGESGKVNARRKRQNGPPAQNNDNNMPQHPQNNQYDDGPMRFYDNQQPPEDVEKEWNFVQKYMSLNEDLRKRIGHSFESFIQSCLFRGVDCHNETYVANIDIKDLYEYKCPKQAYSSTRHC